MDKLDRRTWGVALAAVLLAAAGTARAEFPEKPVTLVVPFAAGGPSDKIARDLAEALRKRLKQTVIVQNVGGAGGTLGAAKVATATPDGYILLVHHIGFATAPALYRKLPYKGIEDFAYLGLINEVPSTLIGRRTTERENVIRPARTAHARPGRQCGDRGCRRGASASQRVDADFLTLPFPAGFAPA